MKKRLKTRKSAFKRILKKNNNKKFYRKKAFKGHLLRKKNSKRLHFLSLSTIINVCDVRAFSYMIPY